MAINSKAKGSRGERAARDQFREAGFLRARRGQQFSGAAGDPDIVVPELPSLHFEIKNCQKGNPYDWLAQAEHDAKQGKMPVVMHKRNNCPWIVIQKFEYWIALIKETDRVVI